MVFRYQHFLRKLLCEKDGTCHIWNIAPVTRFQAFNGYQSPVDALWAAQITTRWRDTNTWGGSVCYRIRVPAGCGRGITYTETRAAEHRYCLCLRIYNPDLCWEIYRVVTTVDKENILLGDLSLIIQCLAKKYRLQTCFDLGVLNVQWLAVLRSRDVAGLNISLDL
jgi:hypothetical protein